MKQEGSTASWILLRWLPAMLLAVVAGAATGAFRGWVGFVIGIQGMVVLGVLGYLVGRLGRGDSDRLWSFGQRLWLGLTCALVVGVVQVLLLSFIKAGPYDSPLEWLSNVIDGTIGEASEGVSRTGPAVRARVLNLTGGAWLFFTALDLLLGAFVFLATCVGGRSTTKASSGSRGGDSALPAACPWCGRARQAGARYCAGCGREQPALAEPEPARGSLAAAALFFLVLIGGVAAGSGLALWNEAQARPAILSLDNLHRNQKLLGSWRLSEGDSLDRVPESQRRFSLKLAGMDEVALVPEQQGSWLVRLRPVGRKGERLEGQLDAGEGFAWFPLPETLGLRFPFPVAATVSAGDRTMRLVVERRTGDKRAFIATRVASAEQEGTR